MEASLSERDNADVLYGLKAISAFLGITPNQAKHRVAQGQIPSFKMGGTVCALRSAIAADMQSRSAAARKAPDATTP